MNNRVNLSTLFDLLNMFNMFLLLIMLIDVDSLRLSEAFLEGVIFMVSGQILFFIGP